MAARIDTGSLMVPSVSLLFSLSLLITSSSESSPVSFPRIRCSAVAADLRRTAVQCRRVTVRAPTARLYPLMILRNPALHMLASSTRRGAVVRDGAGPSRTDAPGTPRGTIFPCGSTEASMRRAAHRPC
jgi:hypothetical protein